MPASRFAFSHCERLVREGDPDRYWATIFAPIATRPFLFALYAFSYEIARVREAVREAVVGEIRLQWWRDALLGQPRGDAGANPVAAALGHTAERFQLPRQELVDLVDARVFDLYNDPMPTLRELEGYCKRTSSTLVRLATLILADGSDPGPAEAAEHAGVCYAITGLLRAVPWHARRGQIYVPQELLLRNGINPGDFLAGRSGSELSIALAEMRATARLHLLQLRALRGSIARVTRPAYQPMGLVEPYLAAMETADYDPFRTEIELPRWRRVLCLWRGALSPSAGS